MHPLACHSLSELASPEPLLINAHTSATMFMLPQCRGTSQRVPVPTQAWAALFLLSLWKLLVKLHVWLSKKTYKAGGQLSFQFMSFGKKLAPWPLSPHQGMLCTPHHNDSVFSYAGTIIESGDGMTYFVPIANGYPLHLSTAKVDTAGQDLTMYLMKLLSDNGNMLETTGRKQLFSDT